MNNDYLERFKKPPTGEYKLVKVENNKHIIYDLFTLYQVPQILIVPSVIAWI